MKMKETKQQIGRHHIHFCKRHRICSNLAKRKDKQDPEIDCKAFKYCSAWRHGRDNSPPKGQDRQTAEVTKIISRAKIGFAGVLERKEIFFLKPDDTKMYTDILIPKECIEGAKAGQKVFVEIISWKTHTKRQREK